MIFHSTSGRKGNNKEIGKTIILYRRKPHAVKKPVG